MSLVERMDGTRNSKRMESDILDMHLVLVLAPFQRFSEVLRALQYRNNDRTVDVTIQVGLLLLY
jgi:hypothetical protein